MLSILQNHLFKRTPIVSKDKHGRINAEYRACEEPCTLCNSLSLIYEDASTKEEFDHAMSELGYEEYYMEFGPEFECLQLKSLPKTIVEPFTLPWLLSWW